MHRKSISSIPLLLACTLAAALPITFSGCATTRSAYYDVWEKLGYPKRQRLVDNVKAARDKQDEPRRSPRCKAPSSNSAATSIS